MAYFLFQRRECLGLARRPTLALRNISLFLMILSFILDSSLDAFWQQPRDVPGTTSAAISASFVARSPNGRFILIAWFDTDRDAHISIFDGEASNRESPWVTTHFSFEENISLVDVHAAIADSGAAFVSYLGGLNQAYFYFSRDQVNWIDYTLNQVKTLPLVGVGGAGDDAVGEALYKDASNNLRGLITPNSQYGWRASVPLATEDRSLQIIPQGTLLDSSGNGVVTWFGKSKLDPNAQITFLFALFDGKTGTYSLPYIYLTNQTSGDLFKGALGLISPGAVLGAIQPGSSLVGLPPFTPSFIYPEIPLHPYASPFEMGANQNGLAFLSVTGPDGIQIAEFKDGAWNSSLKTLSPSTTAFSPHVFVSPQGLALALWQSDSVPGSKIISNYFDGVNWIGEQILAEVGSIETIPSQGVSILPSGLFVAVWQSDDQHFQWAYGPSLSPPRSLSGEVVENRFLDQKGLVVSLDWSRGLGNAPDGYFVFRDGVLVDQLPRKANSFREIIDWGTYVYSIVAFDKAGDHSVPVSTEIGAD